MAAKDKVKTDKRDCSKISVQLEVGRLEGIWVPTIDKEEARLLTRTREQMVRGRVRVGQQFKNRLYQFGMIPFDDETPVNESYINAYLKMEMRISLREALNVLARVWKFVNQEIKSLKKDIREEGKKDKNEAIYRSVPGIGAISSRILSNEIGDMSQFRNQRALYCHTGLTPSEFSSGEHKRKGHITHQGSSRLRWVLTEVSWQAIKEDPKLAHDFNRIAHRRGKKRAIVAIARKLIGRTRACFQKGETYQLGHGLAA